VMNWWRAETLGKVYVFDVDGVLLDVSERLRIAMEHCGGKRNDRFWSKFFSKELLSLDSPRSIGIELLKDRASKGLIAIVSGRPRRLENETIKQLVELCRIPRSLIWRLELRDDGDRRPAKIVKLERVLNILYEGFEIAEVHDDDVEFLNLVRRYLPKTKLYLHTPTGFETL